MTDNVVILAKPDPMIWICDCGCSTFNLRDDAEAECAACDALVVGAGQGWYERIADQPKRDPNLEDPTADVQSNGSEDFARRRIASFAHDDDVFCNIVIRDDGTVHVWGRERLETRAQISWMTRKLRIARQMMGMGPNTEDKQS